MAVSPSYGYNSSNSGVRGSLYHLDRPVYDYGGQGYSSPRGRDAYASYDRYTSRAATPPPGGNRGATNYAPSPPRDQFSDFRVGQTTRREDAWQATTHSTSWLRTEPQNYPLSQRRVRDGYPSQSFGASTHSSDLIPAPLPGQNRYCMVFDLDETLCYARTGYARPRQGIQRLLQVLPEAEVVVWTAGEQTYAEGALRSIGFSGHYGHLVARDGRWYREGGTKDLHRLGRPLGQTLIIENTAQCIESNPSNAILLPDFTGGSDNCLSELSEVIRGLLTSGQTVQDYLRSCPMLMTREVRAGSTGRVFSAYTLRNHAPHDSVGGAPSVSVPYSVQRAPAARGHYRPMRH